MAYNFKKPFTDFFDKVDRLSDKLKTRIGNSSSKAIVAGVIGTGGLLCMGTGFALGAPVFVSAALATAASVLTLNPIGVAGSCAFAVAAGTFTGLCFTGAACFFGVAKAGFNALFEEKPPVIASVPAPTASIVLPPVAEVAPIAPEFAKTVEPKAEAPKPPALPPVIHAPKP